MMCKKAPLEPEMALDFLGLPLMISSFKGAMLHATVLGNDAVNNNRHLYNASLRDMARPENLEQPPQRFIE